MPSKSSFPANGTIHESPEVVLRDRGPEPKDPNPVFGTDDLRPLLQRFVVGTCSEPLPTDDYQVALIARGVRGSEILLQHLTTRDQFVFLPLTWRELAGRLEESLQRSHSSTKKVVQFGEVSINFVSMEVRRSDRLVRLTRQEFKLLKFLVQAPDQVFSRDELLNQVWGYYHYPSTRTVDNHILALRRKLESSPTHPAHFLTVHGTGYKFTVRARE